MEETDLPAARPLLYPLDARPPWRTALLVGLQHVLAMFVPVISVPLILGQALNFPPEQNAYLVSMGLVASGLSTLVQSVGLGPFGSRLLAVQGTSFAFLAPLLQAGKAPGGGLGLMLGMSLLCAPVEIVLAQFLYRLRRVFTPLVSGVVVLLIGLSLIPVGMKSVAGGLDGGAPAWAGLAVAALVAGLVIALNSTGRPLARVSAIPLGLGAGFLVCWIGGWLPGAAVSGGGTFALPWPGRYGFAFRWELVLPFLFAYVITTLETVGDITATSQLSGEPVDGPVYWQRVRGGVMADSFNSVLASLCNSFPNTTFAQNNGIIQMTGVAARRIGWWVGGFLCVLGLVPAVSRLLARLPGPVLGAVTLLLFGFVATAGIRILQREDHTQRDLLILACALAAGIGVPAVPEVLAPLPDTLRAVFASGITTGGLTALTLNALLPRHDR